MTQTSAPIRTLNTMYKRLRLWDRFDVKTLCPKCWAFERFEIAQMDPDWLDDIGLEDTQRTTDSEKDFQRYCPRCNMPLYYLPPKSTIPRALRQAPYDLLSVQLAEFLGQPGFEDACESYLDDRRFPGVYSGLQDGRLSRSPIQLAPFRFAFQTSHLSFDSVCTTSSSSAYFLGPRNPQEISYNVFSAPSSTISFGSGKRESLSGPPSIHEVGEPGGGSLTSDEWRCLAVLYGPAAIPPVLIAAGHSAAARNYLKLAASIKIFMRREITQAELERAEDLYRQFLREYVEIYGAENVTPTFHWILHMAAQIRRFGPVHGFWTYLFERLNKLLKGFATNGHKGGAMEVTFARELKREISLSRLNHVLSSQREDPLARLLASELQKSPGDLSRTGTLAAIAAEAQDLVQIQGGSQPCLPAGRERNLVLEHELQHRLLDWYRRVHPQLSIYHPGEPTAPWRANFLNHRGTFYPKLRLDGKRILAVNEEKSSKSDSLVLLQYQPGTQWVGELWAVVRHSQEGVTPPVTFALVAWLVPLQDTPLHADLYRDLKELEVDFWKYDVYQGPDDFGPDALVAATDLCGMAARCTMEVGGRRIWITTGLSKMMLYAMMIDWCNG
ncbi:hypothetical protein CALCODRAFT_510434 [Calocera cornea HHB12733]|uniref:DUF4218 domain-containing protein n=1 Tax=Calocera cornea HHB12733 TaxID=1353952 RepID=A0A165EI79_9BASI|nr:hypothetical protein CALCODRAFT_510434 [Calocera cornea HHB12733]